MNRLSRILLAYGVTTFLACAIAGVALAGTRKPPVECVDPANAACFTTIQDAVNNATNRTRIDVAAGTYKENVSINNSTGKAFILTIAGAPGTTVDGNNAAPVFTIGPDMTLTLSGLAVQNGNAGTGGGGGISSASSHLTVENCTIGGSVANQGGAINASGGSLVLSGSTVSGNSASGQTQQGGGIFLTFVEFTMDRSTVSGNSAFQGGGLYLRSSLGVIENSTVSANTVSFAAGAAGGGILIDEGAITLQNSTISGNTANYGGAAGGAGIQMDSGQLTINNVTIANNSAGWGAGGGIFYNATNMRFVKFLKISNSILANNTPDDCTGDFESRGFNLLRNPQCLITGNTATDIRDEDPMLGPLQDNGGPTETQALGNGSPAIAKGNPTSRGRRGNHCLPADQRGAPRKRGACDIGAYQSGSSPPTN